MRNIIFLSLVAFFLSGCFGSMKPKKAKFKRDVTYITDEIKKLNNFKDVNIQWSISTFGEDTSNNLKIFLINGKDLPTEDSALYRIGEKSMAILLNSITNQMDYNRFLVYFIQKRNYIIMSFKSHKSFEIKINDIPK